MSLNLVKFSVVSLQIEIKVLADIIFFSPDLFVEEEICLDQERDIRKLGHSILLPLSRSVCLSLFCSKRLCLENRTVMS